MPCDWPGFWNLLTKIKNYHQMQADQNEQPAQQHEQICPVVQAVILLHVKFLNDLQIKTANRKKAGPGIDRNNDGIDQVSK